MYQFIDSKLSIVENDQTGVERAVPAEINSGKKYLRILICKNILTGGSQEIDFVKTPI